MVYYKRRNENGLSRTTNLHSVFRFIPQQWNAEGLFQYWCFKSRGDILKLSRPELLITKSKKYFWKSFFIGPIYSFSTPFKKFKSKYKNTGSISKIIVSIIILFLFLFPSSKWFCVAKCGGEGVQPLLSTSSPWEKDSSIIIIIVINGQTGRMRNATDLRAFFIHKKK